MSKAISFQRYDLWGEENTRELNDRLVLLLRIIYIQVLMSVRKNGRKMQCYNEVYGSAIFNTNKISVWNYQCKIIGRKIYSKHDFLLSHILPYSQVVIFSCMFSFMLSFIFSLMFSLIFLSSFLSCFLSFFHS